MEPKSITACIITLDDENKALRAQHAGAVTLLQSHTDPAACERDKCGCVGETLVELAAGAKEEIERLRVDNKVLATEIERMARLRAKERDKSENGWRGYVHVDASGALERARTNNPPSRDFKEDTNNTSPGSAI